MALVGADAIEEALLGELLDVARPHVELLAGEIRRLRQQLCAAARAVAGVRAEYLDDLVAACLEVVGLLVRPPARVQVRSGDEVLELSPFDLPPGQARVIGQLDRTESLALSHRSSSLLVVAPPSRNRT
ncbi:hypothetical protein [Streptomyces griseorubiginosus]|uniref:hypothetical protein n=1 Tax=Streptomyces griseorubiginosus TaxID=67304 RepID=UPI00340BF94B